MSAAGAQFRFIARDPALGSASLAPMMPPTLKAAQSVDVSALLDTGAAVNVLPYAIGTQLGFLWDQQTTSVQLSGNLALVEARVVMVAATVAAISGGPARIRVGQTRFDPTHLGASELLHGVRRLLFPVSISVRSSAQELRAEKGWKPS